MSSRILRAATGEIGWRSRGWCVFLLNARQENRMWRASDPDDEAEEWREDPQEGEEEPGESWKRPPVICPECGGEEVQFMERRNDASRYLCVRCGLSFEVDD